MTSIVKRIALLAALAVVAVTARAQFGSYSHDLPFMGVDASLDLPIPSNDLVIWHKPETLTGSDGANVVQWIDSSPSGDHLLSTNSGAVGPFITNNVVGGYPIVQFGASQSPLLYQTNGTSHDILRNKKGVTLFLLWRPGSDASYATTYHISQGDSTSVKRFGMVNLGRTVRLTISTLDANSETTYQVVTPTNFHLLTLIHSYTNRLASVYTNGVLLGTQASTGTSNYTSDTTSYSMVLGGAGSSSGISKSTVSEVILYADDLATNDLAEVHDYFKTKYGLW